jgi:hypothetical protein
MENATMHDAHPTANQVEQEMQGEDGTATTAAATISPADNGKPYDSPADDGESYDGPADDIR